MVAEIYPRMTSLIKNSKWRRDLLKGCIEVLIITFTQYMISPCRQIKIYSHINDENWQ